MIFKMLERIRWGKIRCEVKERINGEVAEEAYYDRKGRLIGYWAYGYFDPNLPYKKRDRE